MTFQAHSANGFIPEDFILCMCFLSLQWPVIRPIISLICYQLAVDLNSENDYSWFVLHSSWNYISYLLICRLRTLVYEICSRSVLGQEVHFFVAFNASMPRLPNFVLCWKVEKAMRSILNLFWINQVNSMVLWLPLDYQYIGGLFDLFELFWCFRYVVSWVFTLYSSFCSSASFGTISMPYCRSWLTVINSFISISSEWWGVYRW